MMLLRTTMSESNLLTQITLMPLHVVCEVLWSCAINCQFIFASTPSVIFKKSSLGILCNNTLPIQYSTYSISEKAFRSPYPSPSPHPQETKKQSFGRYLLPVKSYSCYSLPGDMSDTSLVRQWISVKTVFWTATLQIVLVSSAFSQSFVGQFYTLNNKFERKKTVTEWCRRIDKLCLHMFCFRKTFLVFTLQSTKKRPLDAFEIRKRGKRSEKNGRIRKNYEAFWCAWFQFKSFIERKWSFKMIIRNCTLMA